MSGEWEDEITSACQFFVKNGYQHVMGHQTVLQEFEQSLKRHGGFSRFARASSDYNKPDGGKIHRVAICTSGISPSTDTTFVVAALSNLESLPTEFQPAAISLTRFSKLKETQSLEQIFEGIDREEIRATYEKAAIDSQCVP